MALPKLVTPEYTITVPSTGEEIKFRPFLVKEEKVLLIALESENETTINEAIMNIVKECTFGKSGYTDSPLFDIEYLFINIRGKSVGDVVKVNITCPDDNETKVDIEINLDDINVQMHDEHTNIVELTENIKMIMSYPTTQTTKVITSRKEGESETEASFKLLQSCVAEIHESDTIHNKSDISPKEMNEFFESMNQDMLGVVNNFFDTMPKVRHTIKVKNPKTKKTSEVILEGLADFFG